ncbi:hypothetical protein FKP32DRAFT_1656899 [Trametes sanguinea]|nr:hypothetical protein FKP32DRAFT_1656899 [Trametes sanguinea]
MPDNAARLKEQGNAAFKSGDLLRAADFYARAEKEDPTDAVYPSNLSAALYEAGDYAACAKAVIRAWNILRGQHDAKPNLVVRLSCRLAKALCQGVRARSIGESVLVPDAASIEQLRDAAMETAANDDERRDLRRFWQEWDETKAEIPQYTQKGAEDLQKFSKLPMFFKPLDHSLTIHTQLGTDEIIDLTSGWGPLEAYPLHLDKLPTDHLSEVAFLFGGVGDGRHAFGSLAGLHKAYKKLSKLKKAKFRAHLTLLDVHEGTIARDLCIFMLLQALMDESDPVARTELQATLTYTYCGAAMPDYCYNRLQTAVKKLKEGLTATPPALPAWLHVVSDTIPAILPTLDYWLRAKKSTRKTLEEHEHMSSVDRPDMQALSMIPGANADFQRTLQERIASQRADIENTLRTLTDEQLAEFDLLPKTMTVKERRAFILDNMEMLVDAYHKAMRGGKVPLYEEGWYKEAKVFLPPKELFKRHPGVEAVWRSILSNKGMPQPVPRKVISHIHSEWKPNITLFDIKCEDPKCYPGGNGYPDLKLEMFDVIGHMDQFTRRDAPDARDPMSINQSMLAVEACTAFFAEVIASIKSLEGRLIVELICGGLAEELAKMQYKADITRPKHFPRKFTRMWMSNVPDYTHGPLNMIVYAVPQLQNDPQAAVAFNCMLNVPVWAGDEEYFHTYTLLLPEEIPRYLGCRLISSRAVMDVCVLGTHQMPRPLSELATRDELTTWLTRVLFNTFIPGLSKLRPHYVRCPHNLVAFFALVLYLHRVGYPGHWLSEFMARVLSGSMVSDIAPYDNFWPMPVKERQRRVPARKVRTDPWLVDFENILASAYNAIPFPISDALPADFSRDSGDIAVWEVTVQAAQVFSMNPFMNLSSPYDPRTQLLFYQPSVVTATRLIDDMGRIFEGKAQPAPGTFFVLTMQEYVQYQTRIRFRLSRKRVERMKTQQPWAMMAYRHDTGQQGQYMLQIKIRTPLIECLGSDAPSSHREVGACERGKPNRLIIAKPIQICQRSTQRTGGSVSLTVNRSFARIRASLAPKKRQHSSQKYLDRLVSNSSNRTVCSSNLNRTDIINQIFFLFLFPHK